MDGYRAIGGDGKQLTPPFGVSSVEPSSQSKTSATGPWEYGTPKVGEYLIIKISKSYMFVEMWDENSEAIYGKPLCWARINMPEGWEE